tara:strand:- start:537 stop:776 length:240 start_codon:yes stop_codon:yes gene_type:complete
MGLKYNNQMHSSNIPSGLRPNDVNRLNSRSKSNLSKKIEQLYGNSGLNIPEDLGVYLGTESGNILGTESNSGLGINEAV